MGHSPMQWLTSAHMHSPSVIRPRLHGRLQLTAPSWPAAVSGSVQFVKETEHERPKLIGTGKTGEGFGELGFITGKTRAYGARAGPGTQLLLIDAETYTKHLMLHAELHVRHISDELRQARALLPTLTTPPGPTHPHANRSPTPVSPLLSALLPLTPHPTSSPPRFSC